VYFIRSNLGFPPTYLPSPSFPCISRLIFTILPLFFPIILSSVDGKTYGRWTITSRSVWLQGDPSCCWCLRTQSSNLDVRIIYHLLLGTHIFAFKCRNDVLDVSPHVTPCFMQQPSSVMTPMSVLDTTEYPFSTMESFCATCPQASSMMVSFAMYVCGHKDTYPL